MVSHVFPWSLLATERDTVTERVAKGEKEKGREESERRKLG